MLKPLRTTRTGAVASRTSVSNAHSDACLRVAEIGGKNRLSDVSPNVSVSTCPRRFALLMALKCVVRWLLELKCLVNVICTPLTQQAAELETSSPPDEALVSWFRAGVTVFAVSMSTAPGLG
jgi:hypothetical protein